MSVLGIFASSLDPMLGKNLGQERLLWHFLEHYKEIFTLFFKAFQRGVKKY